MEKQIVTPREIEILNRIVNSEFHDTDDVVDNPVWSVCDSKADNAIMRSLLQKGFAGSGEDDDNGKTHWITQEGFDALQAATTVQPAVEQVDEAPTAVEVTEATQDEPVVEPAPASDEAPTKAEVRGNKFVADLMARGYEDTGFRAPTKDGAKDEADRLRQAGRKAVYVTISTSKQSPSFGVFDKAVPNTQRDRKIFEEAMQLLTDDSIDADIQEGIRQAMQQLERAVLAQFVRSQGAVQS